MPTFPVPFAVFGYGTAALTYGLYLLFGFPKARNEEEQFKIKRGLIANGFAFGGIAQFTAGLVLFALYNDIVDATTAAVFGVLWTAIWLNEYFDADPRTLTFLDIAIIVYTIFAGSWALMLGHKVVAFLLWSITALNVSLVFTHSLGKATKLSGLLALENAIVAYYITMAIVYSALGHPMTF
ncbi:hypothetical protein [Thermococcus sp.]|uniref:hypothetical protein n=1 Tax=Thermococcus sp. TaxID=35749 RepID=UPI00260F9DDA|nr:hypothetical protein [Thermococcus sp.]